MHENVVDQSQFKPKITQSYQLCKAAQFWLLEVVHFTVEIVPILLLLAGICVQLTGVPVENEAI
jgi:hypothetical protein